MSGKYFVSYRLEQYEISQTEKAKISRNGLGFCVKFTKTVVQIPGLAEALKSQTLRTQRLIIEC